MNGLSATSNFDYTTSQVQNHIARRAGKSVQERINALKVGQKMQDLPEHLWHDSFRYYVKEDPNRQGGPNLRMIRLDPSKPSLTVTGYIFNKFVHPFENRFITVREAARLQGFPDEHIFQGTLTSAQMQVGNAVPVPLAKAVFISVLKAARKCGIDRPLKAMSLFSGAGGMDIGAEQAEYDSLRIQTKMAIEYWADACQTLRAYYQDRAKVRQADITRLPFPLREWRELSGENYLPDLIYGGPPCQAFSQAGKQKALEDDRGQLIFEFLRFVEGADPLFFVMENVANLRGVCGGSLYAQVLKRMDELGYCVADSLLLAADYGAPQLRHRVFLLGCHKDLGKIELPEPTHSPEIGMFNALPYTSVGEAFSDLPAARYSDEGEPISADIRAASLTAPM